MNSATLHRQVRLLGWLLVLVILPACQTPAGKIRETATSQGFERSSIRADGFAHTVFHSIDYTTAGRIETLHVYLEGDGSPWRYRTVVMPDPTPRRPLMLWLMDLDPAPSVYVGRPCYNGTSTDKGCDSRLWTSGRYSTTVVQSMAGVLRTLVKRHSVSELRLFGHSGGGALAMLLAEELPQVSTVVTVAGNLDTDAWTSHHRYTPLFTSLNPARREPLPDSVRQWHLLGGRDGIIPPELVRPFILRQRTAVVRMVDEFGHGCCWRRVWPEVLHAITTDAPDKLPGHELNPVAPQAAVQGSR